MDDYTDEEALEATDEAPAAGTDDSALRKLKQENQSLRQRLRRTELEANFGKDVVELIPEELPLTKWEEYAGKLAERLAKPQQTEQTEQAAEEAAPEVVNPLAAVATTPPSGAAIPEELLTVRQIKELAKTDPGLANRMVNEGKFVQQSGW